MKCVDCPHYKSGYLYNACAVAEMEYFRQIENCTLVHDDGTINYDDEYFKSPTPTNDNRCVCCGEIIPEGQQTCPNCEVKANDALHGGNC